MPRARLTLPAGPRRDRVLRFTAWRPRVPTHAVFVDGDETRVWVLDANGEVAAETAIASTRAAWEEHFGALEPTRIAARASPDIELAEVLDALARVDYDEERLALIDPPAEALELPGDTGVGYRLEAGAPLDVRVRATASGPGRLAIELVSVDPGTGGPVEVVESHDVAVDGGQIDRRLPVPPAAPDRAIELRLFWRAEDARLRLEELRVLDREPRARPPIVLVVIDTLSAEHMSVYGYPRATTPNLERFAEDAVVFEHAVANAPWTLPSFLSLMSGLYAQSHAVDPHEGKRSGVWEKWSMADSRWTLAEALRAGGWDTGGFDDDPLWEPGDLRLAGGEGLAYGTIPGYVTRADHPDGTPRELPTGPIVARYDEGVAMTDQALGELFDDLERRGLYDDAVIVVTADHGETMGDTDFLFGHCVLDEICVNVPLLIKLPAGESAGSRVTETVQLVDLYPTILELAGVEHEREHLHGRSLVPRLRGAELASAPSLCEGGVLVQSALYYDGWKLVTKRFDDSVRESVLLTYPDEHRDWLYERVPELAERPMTPALVNELRARDDYDEIVARLLAAREDATVELYRIRDDPDETANLAEVHPDRVDALRRLLAEAESRRDAARAAAGRAAVVELSESDREELRKLGYVDD